MTTPLGICPCCGQALAAEQELIFNLESRSLVSAEMVVIFTSNEATIFDLLWKNRNTGRVSTREAIFDYLYGLDPSGGPEIKIVDVWILKIRRRLKHTPIEIVTAWGRGYFLKSISAPSTLPRSKGSAILSAGVA